MACFNYFLFTQFNTDISKIKYANVNNPEDLIVYIYYSNQFLVLYILLMSKLLKLCMNLTCLNLDKAWEKTSLVFSCISLLRDLILLKRNLYLFYLCIRLGIPLVDLLLDIFNEAYHIIKLSVKIHQNYENVKYLNNLLDYKQENEIESIFKRNKELTDEEKERIVKDNIQVCNICLDKIDNGKYLNCGHVFHLKCIKEWVNTNAICPICKAQIITENGFKSKFYNNQLGIANQGEDGNNNQLDEEILEKINLSDDKYNMPFIPKLNVDIEKYEFYKKIEEMLHKLKYNNEIINANNNINTHINNVECGAISFSLPQATVLNRGIQNEIKRIHLELINKNLIELYDNPYNTFKKNDNNDI